MAKARERSQLRLLGMTGRMRSDLLIGTALQTTTFLVLTYPAWAQPAPNAMPTGGSVVAGRAAITQTTNATTISQSSQRAAINWQSFNVGSQQQVTFAQPSASAVALNRVTGPDPSQIAGKISANGQVVLVNQAGVTFYKGAQVNAQSLIVSTADVSNANFMAGKLVFDKAGNPNASVVNQGTIAIKRAGLAALVAPRVANSGVINARLGHVVLAGAKTATLDLYGDGLLSLDVSNQVTKAPVGPGGKTVTALVTNSGTINADGGTVQLTAAAADGVLQTLVQAGGKISANTVGTQTGTVTVAGIGGSVIVTGVLSAAGVAAGTVGGRVAVNATGNVTLASSARINASGSAGGGAVAIGTTLQRAVGGPGTTSAMTAANVTVHKGAIITANATKTGDGGRVAVLSAGTTTMNGSIAATGGSQSGNGGFVEVSGNSLGLSGSVNVLAPNGLEGTILLDPTNLDIVGGGLTSSSVDGEFSGGTLASGAGDGAPLPSTVLASTLNTLGLSGNVVVQASGFIDVQVPVTVNNGLTMQAGGNLTIETGASIQAGGNIFLQAGTITPGAALQINASVTSGGNVFVESSGAVTVSGLVTTATGGLASFQANTF
ncbi:MAG TPA: filamentous hemagglutinin N-terminal domain-containing protein, partial [Acetobacteraceae bacterium]|nr:filamentous hemagglutinin N-terminal domain-containing protein [Acetobacteraceae bacterium]